MVIRILVEKAYKRLWDDLPAEIQEIATAAVNDPTNPLYRPFKKLRPGRRLREGSWSIRVTRNDYRAICQRAGETCSWYWVGPHDEYDRITG